MKINYVTKENEKISFEISGEELSSLLGMIGEIGYVFKESNMSLDDFFKELFSSSTDAAEEEAIKEPEGDFMNPPEERDLLIKCRSVKSKTCPERLVLVKQYLKHQNVDYKMDAHDPDWITYYLTGRQVEELMAHLDRNESSTSALI